MDLKEEIKRIDLLIKLLRDAKKHANSFQKLSEKSLNANPRTHTRTQIQNLSAGLSWAAMNYDKSKVNVAKAFNGSPLDVDTGKQEYSTSPFHKY